MSHTPPSKTLFDLPPELRLTIWESAFPKLSYFASVHHGGCPGNVFDEYRDNWYIPPRCPCNKRQLSPLYTSKAMYGEMKAVIDKVKIDAEYAGRCHDDLHPKFFSRIRKLKLDEAIFPCVSLDMGPLCQIHDILATLPSLEQIVMPEGLGTEMGLRFPSSLPLHIYSCLRSRAGPNSPPEKEGDLVDLVRSDVSGVGLDEEFIRTESLIDSGRIEISSTYRFRVSVSEHVEWPFCADADEKELMNQEFQGEIIWDKTGMRITGIPDLRGEWWYEEWAEYEYSERPDFVYADEELSELGWDLKEILKREPWERRFWVEAKEISYSFD